MSSVNPTIEIAKVATMATYPYWFELIGDRSELLKTIMTLLFPLMILMFQRSSKMRISKNYIISAVVATVIFRLVWGMSINSKDDDSIKLKKNTTLVNIITIVIFVGTLYGVNMFRGKEIYNASNFA